VSNQIITTCLKTMGSDIDVVNSARVSFKKRSELTSTGKLKASDIRLIRYLANHRHLSPFGHCYASFHVQAPIFVARQLVKHEYLRWNEVSRRYVDDTPDLYQPTQWRGRAEDKKQGSSGVVDDIDIGDVSLSSVVLYKSLIDRGVCPEQARMVLPQSAMTQWYWSGSMDAFAKMVCLRDSLDTQKETRQIATDVSKALSKAFPYSWESLMGLTE